MQLSVIIICCNAEATIEKTLQSIQNLADEIIVLDSGSTDNTQSICRRFTSNLHVTDWPGYGIQKQRALDLATKTWALTIDADEAITPRLAASIRDAIKHPGAHSGFTAKEHLVFCGKTLRHCGKPRKCILAKCAQAHFTHRPVHETLVVDGSIGHLDGTFLHDSFQTMHQWLKKMNLYTDLNLADKSKQLNKPSLARALLSATATFMKHYILRRGFLDGSDGLMYCINSAIATYIKYVKLKTYRPAEQQSPN